MSEVDVMFPSLSFFSEPMDDSATRRGTGAILSAVL